MRRYFPWVVVLVVGLMFYFVAMNRSQKTKKLILNPTVTPTPIPAFTKNTPICQLKQQIVENTFTYLGNTDKKNFQQFLTDYQIKNKEKTYAALLYFYPNGFVLPGKQGMNAVYLESMLNFHLISYLPADDDATEQTYFSSFHNFSITGPTDWRQIAFYLNNVGFLSPDTKPPTTDSFCYCDEGFDVYVFEEHQTRPNSLEEFAQKVRQSPSRQYPFKLIKSPETVRFGPWSKVLKLTWSAPASVFPRALVGNGKAVMVEDYLFKEGNTYVQIYFRYSDAMDTKYRASAEKIAFSFKPTLSECGNLPHSYTSSIFDNSPSGGSLYDRSKTSLPENQFH